VRLVSFRACHSDACPLQQPVKLLGHLVQGRLVAETIASDQQQIVSLLKLRMPESDRLTHQPFRTIALNRTSDLLSNGEPVPIVLKVIRQQCQDQQP
jgi:hypothetical protein